MVTKTCLYVKRANFCALIGSLVAASVSTLAVTRRAVSFDSVVAVPDALEVPFGALSVGGQCPLQRRPARQFVREFLRSRVDLVRPHRLPCSLKHHRHGLEHLAHSGRSGARLTRIDQSPTEKLFVESAYPRELNPGLEGLNVLRCL